MNNAQRLVELANQLPEPLLGEVLDFAEFLQHKQSSTQASPASSFATYFGALKQTPLFDGADPVQAQQALRNEWN